MSLSLTHDVRSLAGWLSVALGCTCALSLLVAYDFHEQETDLVARLLPAHMRNAREWKTVSATQIRKGTSIPTDTNVIFSLDSDVHTISRRTLFGRIGTDVRYWGFCFPKTQEEAEELRAQGMPGYLFLSEKERVLHLEKTEDIRYKQARSLKEQRTVREQRAVRFSHMQLAETKHAFEGGDTCFVMVDGSADITPRLGLDPDADGVNSAVEADIGINPANPDTDGDGISDGIELFGEQGTDPTIRESDTDGLMDGLEDANANGRLDPGEPDPLHRDPDFDGLCDGLCPIADTNRFAGEDLNLNGIYDAGETDPLQADSDSDTLQDKEEFYFCLIFQRVDCTPPSL